MSRPGQRTVRGTMTAMPSGRRLAGSFLLAALAVAACGPGSGSTAPGSSGPKVLPSAPGATDVAAASATAGAGGAQAGQTDTDWGRIWDRLPDGFPHYQGSTAADEAATGPASAVLVVQGADPKSVATFYQGVLSSVGYSTDGLSGPLEDGSYVLDMTGSTAGCKVQVAVAPTGGLVTQTILYGAGCPLS